MHELPDMLGLIQVLELMHSQIAQRGWRRHCLAHEVSGESGEENLAAMCDAAEASAVVHGRAVVVVQAQLGFTGVQRHSDAQENTAKRLSPSPRGRTTWPPCSATRCSMSASWRARASLMACALCNQALV